MGILIDFFEALEAPLQSIVKVGIEGCVAFETCHEVLLIIAEQWNNLKNVPMPGGVDKYIDATKKFVNCFDL